jgi:hypothetical protein
MGVETSTKLQILCRIPRLQDAARPLSRHTVEMSHAQGESHTRLQAALRLRRMSDAPYPVFFLAASRLGTIEETCRRPEPFAGKFARSIKVNLQVWRSVPARSNLSGFRNRAKLNNSRIRPENNAPPSPQFQIQVDRPKTVIDH